MSINAYFWTEPGIQDGQQSLMSLLKTPELKLFKMKEIFFALGGINLAVSHCWSQVYRIAKNSFTTKE